MDAKTNGEALLELLRENLVEWAAHSTDLNAFDTLICSGDCPELPETDDALDLCDGCHRQWLDAPFTGGFGMRGGRFVLTARE